MSIEERGQTQDMLLMHYEEIKIHFASIAKYKGENCTFKVCI
jgi:hypothetical protein